LVVNQVFVAGMADEATLLWMQRQIEWNLATLKIPESGSDA
jgi:hypothetical protein